MKSDLKHSEAAKQWKKIGTRQHHGINLPLFSLRSSKSTGIGEYQDLIPLIKWCKQLNLDVIQLLPLNDNGCDTSPYSAISAFALNPLYLSLSGLPGVEQSESLKKQIEELRASNHEQRIPYKLVSSAKERFLREYYQIFFPSISLQDDYRAFIEHHQWLFPYSLFKTIKLHKKWYSWESWEDIPNPCEANLENFYVQYQEEMDFHSFVQFLCFQQFGDVIHQAKQEGVLIKGDIPILISRQSADVWFHRGLFKLEYSAGAPPDMYAKEGQNWGFPIYNWDAIEQSNYAWWIERLKVASQFYDIYRLDHIVGFFRIWTIPFNQSARDGRFTPEIKEEWIPQGEKIMQMMLGNSLMLPIGEDLGEVPPEVRICLRSLGICGTKVMRWERNWETDKSFIPLNEYPVESMTTVSTHDSETLLIWWRDHPDEAKEYARMKRWSYDSYMTPEQQFSFLYDSHHTPSLFHINLLQEYLSLVPGMTWPNPADERINVPGIYSDKNWTYRFKPFIEEIVSDQRLSDLMQHLIS